MISQPSAPRSPLPVFVLAPPPLAAVLAEALSFPETTVTVLENPEQVARHSWNENASALFVELDTIPADHMIGIVHDLSRNPSVHTTLVANSRTVGLLTTVPGLEGWLPTVPVIPSNLPVQEIAGSAREALKILLAELAANPHVAQPAAQYTGAGEEEARRPRTKGHARTEEPASPSSSPIAAPEQDEAGNRVAEPDPAVARLVELGFLHEGPDGVAPATLREAVRAFQRSRDMQADGILAPATRTALLETPTQPRLKRVQEMAEELGVTSEELLKWARGHGVYVRNLASTLPLEYEALALQELRGRGGPADTARQGSRPAAAQSQTPSEEEYAGLSGLAGVAIGYAQALAAMRTDQPGETDSLLLFAGLLLRASPDSGDTATFLHDYLRKHAGSERVVETLLGTEYPGITSLPARPAKVPSPDALPPGSLRAVLELAQEYAAQVREYGGGEPITVTVHARHLVAALLTGTPPFRVETRLEEMGASLYDLRERFLAFLASRPLGESLEAWRGILIPGFFTEVPPPAPYAADAVGEDGVDRLGITSEVNALAAVLAARDASLPISVGLFGDWGTGKSFFMQQMEKRIRTLAASAAADPASPFCSDVVQIRFNAWHYMDANLWASMVDEVFRGLAQELEKTKKLKPAQLQAQIRAQLEAKEGYAAELKRREAGIREEIDRVAAQARQTESVLHAAGDALARSLDRPEVRERLVELAASVGLRDPAFAELQKQTQELRSLRGRVGRLLERRPSPGELAFALVTLAAVPLAAWGVTQALDSTLVQAGAAVVGAVAAAVSQVVIWARPVLRKLRAFVTEMEGLSTRVEQAADEYRRVAEQRQTEFREQMARLEKEQAEVLERQREAAREVVKLQAELHDLADERRFLNFVLERSAAADYRQHQGIIALVRRDFEELSRLLGDVREDRDGERDASFPRVERIILYIDDLDRCPEERVVEVLQAVHLLLAFPLFVVVVGVDSRWLLRSVQGHYSRFFSAGESAGADPEDVRHWSSTPQNYLEKIFQIPFTLRPMDGRGFASLIGSLVPVGGDEGVGDGAKARRPYRAEPSAADSSPESETEDGTHVTGEPRRSAAPQAAGAGAATPVGEARDGTASEAPPATEPPPRSLGVERWERAFMQDLAPLIPSPRAAKRFVNLYRFIRAGTGEARLDAFRGTAAEPGEHRVVALLLAVVTGYPAQAEALFRALDGARDADAPGSWWATVERLEAETSGAAREGRLPELLRTLLAMRPELGMEEVPAKPFVYWAPHVARFSFQTTRVAASARP